MSLVSHAPELGALNAPEPLSALGSSGEPPPDEAWPPQAALRHHPRPRLLWEALQRELARRETPSSIAELSRDLGLSRSTLQRLRRADLDAPPTFVSDIVLYRIARYCGWQPGLFRYGIDPSVPDDPSGDLAAQLQAANDAPRVAEERRRQRLREMIAVAPPPIHSRRTQRTTPQPSENG